MIPSIQWWCSARGIGWTWNWQPFPGVWLFVAAVGVIALRHARRGRAGWCAAAVALLWLTLEWPVGPLGAGYLASVHAFQFMMLAMVLPPLFLLVSGGRATAPARASRSPLGRLGRRVRHPLLAMVVFGAVILITHAPRVVDPLMRSQLGSFALDLGWFASGLAFWWWLVPEDGGPSRLPSGLRVPYLFLGTLAHLYIGMWLLLAPLPVYATYELAPRVFALSALEDQQVAGAGILLLGAGEVLGVITYLFFRWAREEEQRDVTAPAGARAAPSA